MFRGVKVKIVFTIFALEPATTVFGVTVFNNLVTVTPRAAVANIKAFAKKGNLEPPMGC